jgi:hypothetical protein
VENNKKLKKKKTFPAPTQQQGKKKTSEQLNAFYCDENGKATKCIILA